MTPIPDKTSVRVTQGTLDRLQDLAADLKRRRRGRPTGLPAFVLDGRLGMDDVVRYLLWRLDMERQRQRSYKQAVATDVEAEASK